MSSPLNGCTIAGQYERPWVGVKLHAGGEWCAKARGLSVHNGLKRNELRSFRRWLWTGGRKGTSSGFPRPGYFPLGGGKGDWKGAEGLHSGYVDCDYDYGEAFRSLR